MIIASQKRKENIAEYILYMWQIEDLIRANNLDLVQIKSNVIDRFTSLTPEQRKEMEQWYEGLMQMMRDENVTQSGHLQINRNIVSELASFHQHLLSCPGHDDYKAEYYRTLPFIVELRAKAGENKASEIETCLNALYGLLLMRLKQQEITPQTLDALKQISRFMAMLTHYFKLNEQKPLDGE
ncbi:MAG: DUF4924 family protein [Firmicutes bacterium]|nr:DUF4924 family protein [Bacillota bacterium]MCM1400509.1 DUF4924 family protein [Bacteroides sp.]MCM1476863.1 DUF4924 family protein [Bacteroides sp.]